MNNFEGSSAPIRCTVIEHWDHLIEHGNKRQRKDIRVVLPYFIANGLQVDDINNRVLTDLSQYLQAPERDHSKNGLSEKHARWTVNSAVHAITDLSDDDVSFTPLEGPRDSSEQKHEQFINTYSVELEGYFATRNTDTLSQKAEINAFKNCVTALEGIGFIPSSLKSIVTKEVRPDLMQALHERGRMGSFVQAMRTLALFAVHCSHDDAEDAHEIFSAAAHEEGCSQAMPSEQQSRLLPYIEESGFQKIFDQLMDEAWVPSDFDPSSIRRNNRIASALYALLAIFAPATFRLIYSAEFAGAQSHTSCGVRPLLKIGPHDESLEKCIHPYMSKIIDRLYHGYRRHGITPVGIMVGRDGVKRSSYNAVRSAEVLLRSLEIELTLLDLRELGIAKAIMAGDGPDRIARAARMSERAFWIRYNGFSDIVKQIKG